MIQLNTFRYAMYFSRVHSAMMRVARSVAFFFRGNVDMDWE